MALKISKNVGLTDVITDVNPLVTKHDIAGQVVEVRLFLFNDNSAKRYEEVKIQPTDSVSTNESTWFQLAPDNAGVAGTYLSGGAQLTLTDISDSNVAKPFWVKITTPSVGDTQNKSDIKLTITGVEYAV